MATSRIDFEVELTGFQGITTLFDFPARFEPRRPSNENLLSPHCIENLLSYSTNKHLHDTILTNTTCLGYWQSLFWFS